MRTRFPVYLLVFLLNQCVIFSSFGQKVYKISGVIRSTDEEPLQGAAVFIPGLKKGATSKVDGSFQIQKIPPGTYQLRVSYTGYQTETREITIIDKDFTLDFLLQPALLELNEVTINDNPFQTGPVEGSVTTETIERDFLEKSNQNTFVSALQKLPGINAINTGVGIAKPVIRGMSFNRVIVTDRGVKQEGQQWGADHGLEIDQYEPERVTIVKGPSSLLYGSDGLGGVINILPPPIPKDNTLKGSFLGTYKSNNHLLGTSTMLEGNKSGKIFRVRFSTQDFGDYRVPADSFLYNRFVLPIYNQTLKNTAGKERNFTTMGGMVHANGYTTLTVSNFHQKAGIFSGAMGIPREYQLTDDGNSRNIDIPRQVTNHFKVIANSKLFFEDDFVEMDVGYQNNYRREESNPHAHGKGPRPEGNLALGLRLQTVSGNIKYHHFRSGKSNAIYGLQWQYQQNRRSGFEFLLSDFTSASIGAFVFEEYNINSAITFNAGLRFDYGYRNIDAYREPVYSDPETIIGYRERTPDILRHFYNLSGGSGISYYPNQNFNMKFNLGSSFKMPTAPELSSDGIHHGTFRHEQGDSTLHTERGWQADLNFTLLTQKLRLVCTPFFNYFDQYIYLSPTAKFSTLPEGGQVYKYQQDNAIFTGAEISASYQLWQQLFLKGSMEYVWNYNFTTELALPFTPPFSVLGEIEYTLPFAGKVFSELYINLSAQHFSKQNRVDRNEKTTPAYSLINLSTSLDINVKKQPVSLIFTLQNLTDAYYLNHLSRYRLLNIPEQGRNFTFTLKIPFTLIAQSNKGA